jgi:hypothetical protein
MDLKLFLRVDEVNAAVVGPDTPKASVYTLSDGIVVPVRTTIHAVIPMDVINFIVLHDGGTKRYRTCSWFEG